MREIYVQEEYGMKLERWGRQTEFLEIPCKLNLKKCDAWISSQVQLQSKGQSLLMLPCGCNVHVGYIHGWYCSPVTFLQHAQDYQSAFENRLKEIVLFCWRTRKIWLIDNQFMLPFQLSGHCSAGLDLYIKFIHMFCYGPGIQAIATATMIYVCI